jgi:hypothetical protein
MTCAHILQTQAEVNEMALTVLIHLADADPILAEIDALPDVNASYVLCSNPRARDGKSLMFIDPECTRFLFPWHRINFIEAFPSEEDAAEVELFFRD